MTCVSVAGHVISVLVLLVLPCSALGRRHYRHYHHHSLQQSGENERFPHLGKMLKKLDSVETVRAARSHGGSFAHTSPGLNFSDSDSDSDRRFEEDDLPHAQTNSKTRWNVQLNDETPGSSYSYASFKWNVLGSRDKVAEYHRQRYPSSPSLASSRRYRSRPPWTKKPTPQATHRDDEKIKLAITHALLVSREAPCREPMPKVVQVVDYYPHPSKTYIPHCTILHQCGDDTGCCRHETLACRPRSQEKVELYFYITSLGSSRGSSVEKLVFYNHTECACQDKLEEMMPRDDRYPLSSERRTPAVDSVSPFLPGRGLHVSTDSHTVGAGSMIKPTVSGIDVRTIRPDSLHTNSCKCPSEFTSRQLPNSCRCDCSHRHRACVRLKRGREYFSVDDRRCIQSDECQLPSCEYGNYNRMAGRCPRKRERQAVWGRVGKWNTM